MSAKGEKFDRWLMVSICLHAVVFVLVLLVPFVFPDRGNVAWGSEADREGGVQVRLVSSLSGVPLPAPAAVRDNATPNESKGLYEEEPGDTGAATTEPADPAEALPEVTASARTTPRPDSGRPSNRQEEDSKAASPIGAIPYGQGGRSAVSYGQFSTGAGTAGLTFGDGAFGDRYGWYVTSMTRRISQNWLQSLVNAEVQRAPRIYLDFDILRDGTIDGIEVMQSSGVPSLDRSALRALYASDPLPPLPAEYRSGLVSVRFWFEYQQ